MKPQVLMGHKTEDVLADIATLPKIDPEQFNMLVETGEDAAAELIIELVDLFQQEAGPRLDSLQASLEAQDAVAMARHAHALAGSSANLGAQRLWRVCKIMEESAPRPDWERLSACMGLVRHEYEETLGAFQIAIDGLR